MKRLLAGAVVALALAGCSASSEAPSSSPTSPSPDAVAGFTVTSPDFTDGGELGDWATASAFGGQCTGDNLNPALEWTGAPEGTESYAIVMIDRSAGNFIHWVHADIPGTVTSVARGASDALEGADGANGAASAGYFGPCPPGPDHRYEFAVYALDAMLDVTGGVRFAEVKALIDEHELAQASITGMRSGPA